MRSARERSYKGVREQQRADAQRSRAHGDYGRRGHHHFAGGDYVLTKKAFSVKTFLSAMDAPEKLGRTLTTIVRCILKGDGERRTV